MNIHDSSNRRKTAVAVKGEWSFRTLKVPSGGRFQTLPFGAHLLLRRDAIPS